MLIPDTLQSRVKTKGTLTSVTSADDQAAVYRVIIHRQPACPHMEQGSSFMFHWIFLAPGERLQLKYCSMVPIQKRLFP